MRSRRDICLAVCCRDPLMLLVGYKFSPMLLFVNICMLQSITREISFNFSSQVELLKDAEGCIAVHDLAVMHQAQMTELEKDPDGWIVPYVLQKNRICVERK